MWKIVLIALLLVVAQISYSDVFSFADFERMSNVGTKLNKLFLGMATVGAGAMVALAKGAPAVAGSMAKIKVKSGELMRSLGQALRPAFDKEGTITAAK